MESGDVHELARGILHTRIAGLLRAEYERRVEPLRGREITFMQAYDPEGNQIKTLEQLVLVTEDRLRHMVDSTVCPTGFRVSTVWVGDSANFDRFIMEETGFDPGPPILFETAKFREDSYPSDEDSGFEVLQQYPNRTAARVGHAAWVAEEIWLSEKEEDEQERAEPQEGGEAP